MLTSRWFELFHHRGGYDIGILKNEILPEVEVREKRYHYDPCPLQIPMPSSMFLHTMLHPEYYEGCILQSRVPKKLTTGVSGAIGSALNPVGWGAHIHEGSNNLAIALCCMCSSLISLVTRLLWSILQRDVQGGTDIGQYIVGVTISIFALVLFKLSYT